MLLALGAVQSISINSNSIFLGASSEKVIRYDRKNGPFSNEFEKKLLSPEPISISDALVTEKKALAPEEAFQINFKCAPEVSPALCDKVNRSLKSAGSRLAKILLITNPIVVNCDFGPFCEPSATSVCNLANVLGGAQSGSTFAVETGGLRYNYPQALLKQLNTDMNLPFSETDIVASFNSDQKFYFKEDGGKIQSNQVDFEFVAIHELTHGLGFGSGLLEYSSVFNGAKPGYLAPIISGADDPSATTQTIFTEMQPLDIFDFFISGNGKNFKDFAKDIASFPRQNSNLFNFLNAYENSGIPFLASQKAYETATSGSLVFKTVSGLTINLFSSGRFSQGSSISHLSGNNSASLDFLMVPALGPGAALDDIIKSVGGKGVYGPQILAIMESIGWPTVNSPEVASVRMSTIGSASTSSAALAFILIFLINLF